MTESMKGGLWLTAMGRIVLDNHNNEVYSEPGDRKIMTKEELTNGIKISEFIQRLWDRGFLKPSPLASSTEEIKHGLD